MTLVENVKLAVERFLLLVNETFRIVLLALSIPFTRLYFAPPSRSHRGICRERPGTPSSPSSAHPTKNAGQNVSASICAPPEKY